MRVRVTPLSPRHRSTDWAQVAADGLCFAALVAGVAMCLRGLTYPWWLTVGGVALCSGALGLCVETERSTGGGVPSARPPFPSPALGRQADLLAALFGARGRRPAISPRLPPDRRPRQAEGLPRAPQRQEPSAAAMSATRPRVPTDRSVTT